MRSRTDLELSCKRILPGDNDGAVEKISRVIGQLMPVIHRRRDDIIVVATLTFKSCTHEGAKKVIRDKRPD